MKRGWNPFDQHLAHAYGASVSERKPKVGSQGSLGSPIDYIGTDYMW